MRNCIHNLQLDAPNEVVKYFGANWHPLRNEWVGKVKAGVSLTKPTIAWNALWETETCHYSLQYSGRVS